MPDKIYTLSLDTIRQLRDQFHRLRQQVRNLASRVDHANRPGLLQAIYLGKADGDITAYNFQTETPGSGTASLWRVQADVATERLSHPVKNAGSIIHSGDRIFAVRDAHGDMWAWQMLAPLTGKLDSTINAGDSGTVSLWAWNGTTEVDTTVNVTARNWSENSGASNDRVEVWPSPQTGQFYFTIGGGGTAVKRFRLTDELTQGNTAPAIIREWNGAAYQDMAGGSITVHDYSNVVAYGRTNDEGLCFEIADRTGIYEILEMQVGPQLCQLTTELTPGGTAQAKPLIDTAENGNYSIEGSTITVYDDFASDGCGFWAPPNARVWVQPRATGSQGHLVIRCEQYAERVNFSLDTFLEVTQNLTTVKVESIENGFDPGTGGFLTVHNPADLYDDDGEAQTGLYLWQGEKGATGWADRDNTTEKYWIRGLEPPRDTARWIEATATQNMGYFAADEVSCTLLDWYQGEDPTGSGVGSSLTIYDGASNNGHILSGDTLRAVWNERESRYEVVQGGSITRIGKLDATLSNADSVSVSIYGGTPGSESDTTVNVTAWDFLLSSGQTVASGTQVTLAWMSNPKAWYVTGAQCP